MRLLQLPPLRVRVGLAVNGYSSLTISSECMPHHKLQFSILPRKSFFLSLVLGFFAGGGEREVLSFCSGNCQHILNPTNWAGLFLLLTDTHGKFSNRPVILLSGSSKQTLQEKNYESKATKIKR